MRSEHGDGYLEEWVLGHPIRRDHGVLKGPLEPPWERLNQTWPIASQTLAGHKWTPQLSYPCWSPGSNITNFSISFHKECVMTSNSRGWCYPLAMVCMWVVRWLFNLMDIIHPSYACLWTEPKMNICQAQNARKNIWWASLQPCQLNCALFLFIWGNLNIAYIYIYI